MGLIVFITESHQRMCHFNIVVVFDTEFFVIFYKISIGEFVESIDKILMVGVWF